MQMYIISPLMIFPLWWLVKTGKKIWAFGFAAFWLVLSTLIPLSLTIVNDWPASSATGYTTFCVFDVFLFT